LIAVTALVGEQPFEPATGTFINGSAIETLFACVSLEPIRRDHRSLRPVREPIKTRWARNDRDDVF